MADPGSLQQLAEEVAELKRRLDAIAPSFPEKDGIRGVSEGLSKSDAVQAAVLLRPLMEHWQTGEGSPILLHSIWKGGRANVQITSESQLSGEDLTSTARMAAALGNEQRLRLMQILAFGEKTSAELAGHLGLKGGPLYHHLKELAAAHLIEQQGRNCYRLTESGYDAWMTVRALHRRAADQG